MIRRLIFINLASLCLTLLLACGDESSQQQNRDRSASNQAGQNRSKQPRNDQKASADADVADGLDGASGDGDPLGFDDENPPAPTGPSPAALWQGRRLLASGRQYAAQENMDAAISALKGARDALPDDGWIRHELAQLCLMAEDLECAHTEAEAATKRTGGTAALEASSYEVLARTKRARGDQEAARAAFIKSLSIRPSSTIVDELSKLGAPDAGAQEAPQAVVCAGDSDASQPALAALGAHPISKNRVLCPLIEEPYIERSTDGIPVKTYVVAALEQHREAPALLGPHGGLGASGTFKLVLVTIAREQPHIVVLDEGRRSERSQEIIRSLEARIRRITLGPSRPGLVVELTTNGWWDVARDATPFAFERHELYLVGQHLSETDLLLNQVSLERGHRAIEDCVVGDTSESIEKRGTIWLEDLDLSGVPEICQESLLVEPSELSWLGTEPLFTRESALCHQWVASALQRRRSAVPSVELDSFDRDRAVHQVLEVARVPAQLRSSVRNHLGTASIIAAKALELTTSGMRTIAVLATDTQVKVLGVSASDNVNILDLVRIGHWHELFADIDTTDPNLIEIVVTARGDELEDAVSRRWVFFITAQPGQPPRLALENDLYVETAPDEDPCPQVTRARYRRETLENTLFVTFVRRQRTGPGTRAAEQAQRQACAYFNSLTQAPPDAGVDDDVELPRSALDICPYSSEALPRERFAQSADGRFARTTLPQQ